MRILLVDDNVEITEPLSKFLQKRGHYCIAINDGRNCSNLLQTQSFDAVILDISMPEFSGFDVIDELEKNDTLKDNNIIVFTATSGSNEQFDELLKRGIKAVIKKPLKLDVLLKTLEGIQTKNNFVSTKID